MEGKRSILVDENDEEFVTKYIAEKNGLSAGWRGFAIDHQLVDGDALVFQLIDSTTFKVYIIRVNDEANNDSDMNDKENHVEINKNQEENVSEGVVKEKEEAGSRVQKSDQDFQWKEIFLAKQHRKKKKHIFFGFLDKQ